MSTLSKFYGRKKGRRLRPLQQGLLDEMLTSLSLELPPELPSGKPIWLEIGFGAGEHLAGQAEKNPDVHFIGCEAFLNGIVSLLQHIHKNDLNNIRIYPNDARQLLEKLPDQSIDRTFVLFPDPWPKKKHHKRRLVSLAVLKELARVMKPGGELRIATDDDSYAEWIEETLEKQDFFLALSRDIHKEPQDWVPTRYQARAKRLGNVCRFYCLTKK